jgi:hypothetical protein
MLGDSGAAGGILQVTERTAPQEVRTMSEDSSVATARINAWQAIVVALITGAVSIVTTLAATGQFGARGGQTEGGGTGASETGPALLDAPVINFQAQRADVSLDECRARAGAALKTADLTGTQVRDFWAFGYQGGYTGIVWCHTDVNQVIFLTAGREEGPGQQLLRLLQRAY